MEAVTITSLLTDAVGVVTSGIGSVWTLITSNPLAATFAGVSILGVCIGLFGAIKQSV